MNYQSTGKQYRLCHDLSYQGVLEALALALAPPPPRNTCPEEERF